MARNKKRRISGKRVRGNWRGDRQPLASGHYLPVDPRLTSITCPDCGAHWEAPDRQRKPGLGGALDHAPTCPIGKGYASAGDEDRAWFIANPMASERVRAPSMAEVQAIMLATGQALPDMPMGVSYQPGGEVTVRKMGNDLRTRDFSRAVLFAQPVLSPPNEADAGYDADEYDQTGTRIFREYIGPADFEGQL